MTFIWEDHAKIYSQTSLRWCPLGNNHLGDKYELALYYLLDMPQNKSVLEHGAITTSMTSVST